MDPDRVAKALADAQRLQILQRIAEKGEICCGEVCEGFGIAQATVSHHLKELLAANLVERRKQGQHAYFRFKPEVMRSYLEHLQRKLGMPLAVSSSGHVDSTTSRSDRLKAEMTTPIPTSISPRS